MQLAHPLVRLFIQSNNVNIIVNWLYDRIVSSRRVLDTVGSGSPGPISWQSDHLGLLLPSDHVLIFRNKSGVHPSNVCITKGTTNAVMTVIVSLLPLQLE